MQKKIWGFNARRKKRHRVGWRLVADWQRSDAFPEILCRSGKRRHRAEIAMMDANGEVGKSFQDINKLLLAWVTSYPVQRLISRT